MLENINPFQRYTSELIWREGLHASSLIESVLIFFLIWAMIVALRPRLVPVASGFDMVPRVVCSVSLLASLLAGCEIIGSIRPGFHLGAWLLINLILNVQVILILFAVAIPAAVLFICRRLFISRLTWYLLASAILGVFGEVFALRLIPLIGGGC